MKEHFLVQSLRDLRFLYNNESQLQDKTWGGVVKILK